MTSQKNSAGKSLGPELYYAPFEKLPLGPHFHGTIELGSHFLLGRLGGYLSFVIHPASQYYILMG